MATIKSTGKITGMKEFKTFKGPGLDVFIEDTSEGKTLYLQVVLYDSKAKNESGWLKKGSIITIEGPLGWKYYQKSDGTQASSLVVVNPSIQPAFSPEKQELRERQELQKQYFSLPEPESEEEESLY